MFLVSPLLLTCGFVEKPLSFLYGFCLGLICGVDSLDHCVRSYDVVLGRDSNRFILYFVLRNPFKTPSISRFLICDLIFCLFGFTLHQRTSYTRKLSIKSEIVQGIFVCPALSPVCVALSYPREPFGLIFGVLARREFLVVHIHSLWPFLRPCNITLRIIDGLRETT